MFSAQTEFDLVAEGRGETDEGRHAIVGNFPLQQLPFAEIIRQRQSAVAQEIENVPEDETVAIEDDASLSVYVLGHYRGPGG